jgi:hypothetical protein
MPPGMQARLLRHYTFLHYGVQKDYQGAAELEKISRRKNAHRLAH